MDPQAPLYMYPQGVARSVGVGGGTTGDSVIQVAKDFSGYASPGAAGTVLRSNGIGVAPTYTSIAPTYQVFTSGSGTYTSPTGCTSIEVELVGGGGGGSLTAGTTTGSAGAAGGYLKVRFAPGSYSYAVGAAGTGAATAPNDGTAGGNTTFSTLAANGGGAGSTTSVRSTGGSTTTTGALTVLYNITGQSGSGSMTTLAPGGSTPVGFTGHFSPHGPNTTPSVPQGFGAGGCAAAATNYVSASGAPSGTAGRIVVKEYY